MRLKEDSSTEYRYDIIIRLRASGNNQKAIAAITDCSQSRVSKVLKRHRSLGTVSMGIKGKAAGKVSKLSPASIETLKTFLLDGALAHGFETDNWTRERIADLIKSKLGIEYHASHVSKLMKKIGFSLQKPIYGSYRQQASEVEKWKSETLRALKKSDKRRFSVTLLG